jgi:hypothetical protein
LAERRLLTLQLLLELLKLLRHKLDDMLKLTEAVEATPTVFTKLKELETITK